MKKILTENLIDSFKRKIIIGKENIESKAGNHFRSRTYRNSVTSGNLFFLSDLQPVQWFVLNQVLNYPSNFSSSSSNVITFWNPTVAEQRARIYSKNRTRSRNPRRSQKWRSKTEIPLKCFDVSLLICVVFVVFRVWFPLLWSHSFHFEFMMSSRYV